MACWQVLLYKRGPIEELEGVMQWYCELYAGSLAYVIRSTQCGLEWRPQLMLEGSGSISTMHLAAK